MRANYQAKFLLNKDTTPGSFTSFIFVSSWDMKVLEKAMRTNNTRNNITFSTKQQLETYKYEDFDLFISLKSRLPEHNKKVEYIEWT